MKNGKFTVIKNSEKASNSRMFSDGDMAIVNDFRFGRRPLNEFERERGKRLSEKLDQVMDYIDHMDL